MGIRFGGLAAAALTVAGACTTTTTETDTAARRLAEIPEAVRAIAAPHQDLASVELRSGDGCYWYRHAGPVETTYLPLKTVEGRPICTRTEAEAAAAATPAAG